VDFDLKTDGQKAQESYSVLIGAKYRQLFASAIGQEVLMDILDLCGYGNPIPEGDNYSVACHNLAIEILKRIAIGGNKENLLKTILG
jgi:hypothetical protein